MRSDELLRNSLREVLGGPGEGSVPAAAAAAAAETTAANVDVKGKVKQSKRIPFWVWFVIAKGLGIKLHPSDKPIISTVLHILTVGCGAGMVFTKAFYSGYDIMSVHSATDILDGTVSIMMAALYCGVGIYSHRLAFRLFVHPKFLKKFRLHSKTVMKLNAAFVVFVVIFTFVVVQNLSLARYAFRETPEAIVSNGNHTHHAENPCQNIRIPLVICQSFFVCQLVFSFFFLLWTALVAVVLISVARTHTIDIRRFMCELACDAQMLDHKFRRTFYNPKSRDFKDNLKHYHWVDHDRIGDLMKQATMEQAIAAGNGTEEKNKTDEDAVEGALEDDDSSSGERRRGYDEQIRSMPNVVLQLREEDENNGRRFQPLQEEEQDHWGEDEEEESHNLSPHIMSGQEIMHKYWKLVSSTRLTSVAFQRWMCVLTVSVLFWSSIRLVYWLSHTPTLYGILSFILPLLLLPLLASAYAEVNYEGIKVIQTILPTPERLHMFQYLYGMPIQLTAYGHRISYGTMGTVLAAIMAAFASKILLQEMNKIIN